VLLSISTNPELDASAEWNLALEDFNRTIKNNLVGDKRNAIIRLYYSAFHAARSLLIHNDSEFSARTHQGVLRFFAKRFIKEDSLVPEMFAIINELKNERELAEYTGDHPGDAITKDRFGKTYFFLNQIHSTYYSQNKFNKPPDPFDN
jgi:uncharacterized protein (UPF0332 family)